MLPPALSLISDWFPSRYIPRRKKLPKGYATEDFKWVEFECSCGCGVRNVSKKALSKLQRMRDIIGKPFVINSACRCPLYNARVGGAPLSRHRCTEDSPSDAFDISLAGHDKQTLIDAAVEVGFDGIGVNYQTFLHVDDRGYRARW